MATDYETILVDVDDVGVATLTLNRPEQRNAFNFDMDREFTDAMWALEKDEHVRVIVVTGAGKGFCAGIDLSDGAGVFGAEGQAEHDAKTGSDSETVHERASFWKMSTPIIGAINGSAVGMGLTLPLLFDIRLVAEEAKLSFVFTRRGLLPEANSTWLLPRMIGVSRALELLISGRTFSGREAAQIGLASSALPAEQVLPAAQELAREIAVQTSGASVGLVKRLTNAFLEEPDRVRAMTLETKLTWWMGEQPDVLAGVSAWMNKQDPEWQMSKHVDLPEDLQFERSRA